MFHRSLLRRYTDLLFQNVKTSKISDVLLHRTDKSSLSKNNNILQCRFYYKKILRKIQSPEEKADLPVFQYASEGTSKQKRVYVWGLAKTGALCKPEYMQPKRGRGFINIVQKPARLEFAAYNDVVDVACGNGFTLLAIKTKDSQKVFGSGINTDCQIGYHCIRQGRPLGIVCNPCPIDIPFKDSSTAKVKQVACGRAHSVVLTSEGVYTFGNNSYGQCGRNIVEDEDYGNNLRIYKLTEIEEQVQQIACGQDHSLFLTEDGTVYSCGLAADGQTGVGHYKTHHKVLQVIGDIKGEKIVYLTCRADTVLAISDKGDVFGWGNSEYKQLVSSGSKSLQLNVARHLKLNLGRIIHAAASGSTCAVVDDSGQVWVWGYGILGKGPKANEADVPTLIPSPIFGRNEFNPENKVAKVYAGMHHFGAVTEHNDLYMWGRNKYGCVGLGIRYDQYFPLKVNMPAKVIKLSCGVDHTVALCKPYI